MSDPITDAERTEALAVLSRLRDGRDVPAEQAASAQALAARDPQIAEMLAAWERQAALLASEPAVRARPGFTDRVMTALSRERSTPVEVLVLPFVRRLAVAAALLVTVSLGWTLAHPAPVMADADVQRQKHVVDVLRHSAFEADDLDAGLRARLKDDKFNGGARENRR